MEESEVHNIFNSMSNGNSSVEVYEKHLVEHNQEACRNFDSIISFDFECDSGRYIDYLGCRYYDLLARYRILINTLDSNTTRDIQPNIIKRDTSLLFAIKEIVCTDPLCIYEILKRRLLQIAPLDKVISFARKYTQRAVDTIVNYHQERLMPSLLGWLTVSSYILQRKNLTTTLPPNLCVMLYIDYDYIGPMDNEESRYVKENCELLYQQISNAISELS